MARGHSDIVMLLGKMQNAEDVCLILVLLVGSSPFQKQIFAVYEDCIPKVKKTDQVSHKWITLQQI